MAQHFIDFSAETIGNLPSELTSRWASDSISVVVASSDEFAGADLTAMGDKSLRIEGTGFSRKGWEWVAGSTEDVIRGVLDIGGNNANWIPSLVLRGAGESEGARTGYVLWVRKFTNSFRIVRYLSGVETALVTGTIPLARLVAEVELSAVTSGGGCTLEARYWEYGTARPATPNLTFTDTTPLAVGWCGVGTTNATGAQSFFGELGVGTDGDAAPTEPVVAGGAPELTLPSASSITSSSIVPNVTLTF